MYLLDIYKQLPNFPSILLSKSLIIPSNLSSLYSNVLLFCPLIVYVESTPHILKLFNTKPLNGCLFK